MKLVLTLLINIISLNLLGTEPSDSSFVEILFYDTSEVKEIRIENKNCVYLDFYNLNTHVGYEYIYENYRQNTRAFRKYCKTNNTIDPLLYYYLSPDKDYYYLENKVEMDSIFLSIIVNY